MLTCSFFIRNQIVTRYTFSDRISAWIILLPLYMLFMIPWTLILIVYR